MQIDPLNITAQVWAKTAGEMTTLGAQSLFGLITGDMNSTSAAFSDVVGWQVSWWRSIASDLVWHTSWASDVSKKWLKLTTTIPATAEDPRAIGLLP